jgi:hypothetical protein
MMVDVEDLTLGCSTNETACETSVASVCRQRRPDRQEGDKIRSKSGETEAQN